MTGLRSFPLHVTEFCGEMQGKFKVGLARLISCDKTTHVAKKTLITDLTFCMPQHTSSEVTVG